MPEKIITFQVAGTLPDPDVEIVAPENVIFRLHSSVLKMHSVFFERSLSDTWVKEESTSTGSGSIRYRYGVRRSGPGWVPEPVPPNWSSSHFMTQRAVMPKDYDLVHHPDTYHRIFAAMYCQRPPSFHSIYDAPTLGYLAEILMCLPVVRNTLEKLYLDVLLSSTCLSGSPPKLDTDELERAYQLQSRPLFREAFIHVIGNINGFHTSLDWYKGLLGGRIFDVMHAEYSRLAVQMRDLERELLLETPQNLADHGVIIGMLRNRALAAATNAVGQRIKGREAKFYRTLRDFDFLRAARDIAAEKSVLEGKYPEKCRRTNAAARVLGDHIKLALEKSKLLHSNSIVPDAAERYDYLTCARISDEQMPWNDDTADQ